MSKPVVSIIVAMSRNRVIGRDGGMPWHLSEDLKHFKAVTMGKPIIMGRKTFESIGKALSGRLNIVISHQKREWPEGITGVDSLKSALNVAVATDPDEIMIIGGGAIYRAALPMASRLYLTEIEADINGDTCFPDFDLEEWQEISRRAVPKGDNKFPLSFVTLERRP